MSVKRFNTTGKCIPEMHYMVNIDRQVEAAAKLVRQGDYFCINRGRQYGKTTTLAAIKKKLEAEGYSVFSISFESLEEEVFASVPRLLYTTLFMMYSETLFGTVVNLSEETLAMLKRYGQDDCGTLSTLQYKLVIANFCSRDKLVVLIDEVDQAGNYLEFIKYLGLLRDMFLKRETHPTFLSVILAGVYDVKNLKLKLRSEEGHQYNSPWNIAVPFDENMALPADGIADMLAEYMSDHNIEFDNIDVGRIIFDYTSGYPFLVSRLCQIIDAEGYEWDKNGVQKAVNAVLKEENTLFDDFVKKLNQFPDLKELMKNILYLGIKKVYSPDEHNLQLARRFNFVTVQGGLVKIACRLMETRLYNLFLAEDDFEKMFRTGMFERNQFVHDGIIDMKHLLERFCVHFNEVFQTADGSMDHEFIEKQGRKQFMLYLKPFINGVGNFYVEAETRDETRTDLVVDYLGLQYVIELKIWHGNAYNERGEKQLSDYLDYFNLQIGYMVSFCFNKNKQPGVKEVMIGNRKIIEALV